MAGFDTTSNLLQSITFHLAKNPDIQEKLYQEIREVSAALNGKQVTYEALLKLKFLDMVVSEGLHQLLRLTECALKTIQWTWVTESQLR